VSGPSSPEKSAGATEDSHTVPGAVLFSLVELVAHWGVSPEELLAPFRVTPAAIAQPLARFPRELYLALTERARALTAEPALGLFWGLQMRVSTFGYLGFALMTTATLRGAIELAIQFVSLGATADAMHLFVEGDMASLVLDEHPDCGSVRDVIGLGRLVALWKMAEGITGRALDGVGEVPFAEPPYMSRFAERFPPVRFGQPKLRLVLNAELLDYPLVMANPLSHQLALEQCALELKEHSAIGRLVRTVRGLLWTTEGVVRTPADVARAVQMSPRTLRRKLTEGGTSLSTLLDEDRRERALLRLRSTDLSIAEIGERLGFHNTQNFERAFRRWTGTTPAAYRRS
jgi:AraC-like DNA-binding protein